MHEVKALVFDTFGTVVDWRGSIARRIDRAARAKGLEIDGDAFARSWRAGYRPGLERVISGERPFTPIDAIHRERLDAILGEFGITDRFDETERAEMVLWWHRLDPWPDSVPGLKRLASRFLIGPLSNGSTVLLASMAKRAGIPWDFIMSSSIVRAYKRHPDAYLNCCRALELDPRQVMMCAAHNDDLESSQSHGMRTAYINRPYEYGPDQTRDFEATGDFDIVTDEIGGIADALGC